MEENNSCVDCWIVKFAHLVLLGPVLHGVTIVEVSGGAAGGGGGGGGGAPTPALLLHPGGAVRVYLPAHGEGGAERQVSVRVLDRHTQSYLVQKSTVVKSGGQYVFS